MLCPGSYIFADCGAPPSITGIAIPSGDTWLGSTIVIQCETGYLPDDNDVSSATITCLATGDWSPAAIAFKCLRGYYQVFKGLKLKIIRTGSVLHTDK